MEKLSECIKDLNPIYLSLSDWIYIFKFISLSVGLFILILTVILSVLCAFVVTKSTSVSNFSQNDFGD